MTSILDKYQFLLFDWDGCLAQTLQIHLQAYKDTFAEFGIFPSDTDITHQVFGDWNGPAKLGDVDLKVFTEKYLARVDQNFAYAPLYPNAYEAVQTLADTKHLTLVTTSSINQVDPALENSGMKQFFQNILTAEDVTNHKPDAEIILTALKNAGGTLESAIIIGDSKSDLGAAQNAGIDSVLFFPPDHSLFYAKDYLIETYSPTHVIEDHAQLLR